MRLIETAQLHVTRQGNVFFVFSLHKYLHTQLLHCISERQKEVFGG